MPDWIKTVVFHALFVGSIVGVAAAEGPPKITPQAMVILKANCFGCHNEEKKKGGLLLTSRKGVLKGNEDGPVLSLGRSEERRVGKECRAGGVRGGWRK